MGFKKVCCCLCRTGCIVFGICELFRSLLLAVFLLLLLIRSPPGSKGEVWAGNYMDYMDQHFEVVVDELSRPNLEEFFSGCHIFVWIGLVLSFILMINSGFLIYGACHKRKEFILPMLIINPIQFLVR